MNFIPEGPTLATYVSYGFIGLSALAFLVLIVLFFMRKIIGAFLLLPFLGLAAGGFMLAVSGSNTLTPTAQERAAAEVIEEDYGIDLDSDQIKALEYPRYEPAESFKAFGSFEQMLPDGDGGYELNRIFLIWEDGKMKLANSTDGESFAPLKTERN